MNAVAVRIELRMPSDHFAVLVKKASPRGDSE
jgi:hypothetical protein